MTISELNNKLDIALKKYIKLSHHFETGKMYNSIKFDCKYSDEFIINFSSQNYIQYLDDGTFLEDFFLLETTKDIISEFISTNIII